MRAGFAFVMTRAGFVAVVGRPNAGKSTFVNALAGRKVTIVSRRRQTTRGVVRAVCEHKDAQIVLLDSPGWQSGRGGKFSRAINGGALWAAESADAVVFMLTPKWGEEDEELLNRLPDNIKVTAAINKIDLVKNKKTLLPFVDELRARRNFSAVVPLCALRGDGVEVLADEVANMLPSSPALFASDDCEDRDFLLAELLREKLFRFLRGELPYRVGVLAVSEKESQVLHVRAEIYVERDTQKAIVIGGGGETLKTISSAARRDMERLSGGKVFVRARVLVRPAWRQDAKLLAKMRIGAPSE